MQKILVIDDEADLRQLMFRCLTSFGYEVYEVKEKSEIVPAIFYFKPDLIILDVMLVGANGRDICREIKISEHQHIPILLYSANPAMLENFDECNANDVLNKPFDLNTLRSTVQKLLLK